MRTSHLIFSPWAAVSGMGLVSIPSSLTRPLHLEFALAWCMIGLFALRRVASLQLFVLASSFTNLFQPLTSCVLFTTTQYMAASHVDRLAHTLFYHSKFSLFFLYSTYTACSDDPLRTAFLASVSSIEHWHFSGGSNDA
jgi:hypothetical protein